jgi:endonuclease/exonuclease/phosphatase family metal-dependent hydrolase
MSSKIEFLSELSAFCSRSIEPLLIGGDFNILRYMEERNRPHSLNRFSDMFNTLINFHELREIVMTGGLFTWSNNQEILILEKLDSVLATKEWEDFFPNAIVKKLSRDISDHNPLILSMGSCNTPKRIQFKFEKS